MIEFQLQADSRILRAILPKIREAFGSMGKCTWDTIFPCPNLADEDFSDAWKNGLQEDASEDRRSLARVIMDPRFQHGYIQVEEKDADSLIRALSELRLTIRENFLSDIEDKELESGSFEMENEQGSVKLGYFSYLILAEIQERLINSCS